MDLAYFQAVADFEARLADLELAVGTPLERTPEPTAGGGAMSERNYKQAFAAAAVICIVLAVALGYLLFHRSPTAAAPEETSPWWRRDLIPPSRHRQRRFLPVHPRLH